MNLDLIQQPFLDKFPGDDSYNPMQRQTPEYLYCLVKPERFSEMEVLHYNVSLGQEIGLGMIEDREDELFLGAQYFPDHIKLYSTAYAGHQFGNWAGQLGDGRAINAGEITYNDIKTELQWKGAGATPYSRHADGRAVLRSSIREYLMSEAMFHLNIPTTRALSLVKSGEDVMRDMLYNGNPAFEDGAIVVRTGESFLRFGHFELLAARGQDEVLKNLIDYTITRYFPEINSVGKQKYLDWLEAVSNRTINMVVGWFRTGFVHGVMNTDNMSILGLTIDYGPFSFLDEYSLDFTPNTTDLPGRRYAFGRQGKIAQWNLWQLANAVYPIIKDEEALQNILNSFSENFWLKHDQMLAEKFGFDKVIKSDEEFFSNWQTLMQDLSLDYTLFFQYLEKLVANELVELPIQDFSYKLITLEDQKRFSEFIMKYRLRLKENTFTVNNALSLMQKSNPKFILRNYLLYECIEEVKLGKMELFNKLWEAIQNPYVIKYPEFNVMRPTKFNSQPGCSTLSCSS